MNPAKVYAVLNIKGPKGIKDVQKLTRRIMALSNFISRSTEKSFSFFEILRKGWRVEWDDEYQKAFEKLKLYLAELCLLTKPIPGEMLYLYLAVGESSLSVILLNEEDKLQKPIYYISKLIQEMELRYSEIEKVSLALMMTVCKPRPYFLYITAFLWNKSCPDLMCLIEWWNERWNWESMMLIMNPNLLIKLRPWLISYKNQPGSSRRKSG